MAGDDLTQLAAQRAAADAASGQRAGLDRRRHRTVFRSVATHLRCLTALAAAPADQHRPLAFSLTGGRILALDVGSSKCGIAVSDPGNMIAFPIHQYRRNRSVKKDVAMIRQLMEQHNGVALAVGLPLDLRGNEGQAVGVVRDYTEQLINPKKVQPAHALSNPCCD